mmetsp:Transcript_25005/g.63422  ORF Transcript_25005/g.63422 Transcript_25005/m.63422 type:complete len:215 (-) Transcript_25005:543-1187(-)
MSSATRDDLRGKPRAASASLGRAAREGYVWEDAASGRRRIVNNENGDHISCDKYGNILPICRVGVSGVAETKTRMLEFKTKGAILHESLVGPEPARPGKLSAELGDERVVTKERYRQRPVLESELWVKEVRVQRLLYPERVEAQRVADQKFKKKVEDAHKNYRALEAQLGPAAGGLGGFEARPSKRLTRKELEPYMHLDVATVGKMDPFGLFRP